MPSTSFDDLDSRFRPIAQELFTLCNMLEPMRVVYTLRTPAEQADALRRGTSRTMKSKHLAQPPDGLSHAIDICPVRLLPEKLWAPLDPVWSAMGAIGVALGLTWGGNWPKFKDRPHFEWEP
jgi:peptidoglycan L-alanyl-D-glutamate endopeptidase CwlK